jgi:RNA polymerase sigma-70 factor, ECF subfamily
MDGGDDIMIVMTAEADFDQQARQFRPELLAHCYRMLGSVDDAEDAVQETYLRAWRGYRGFEGRSSMRTWLHRIATNACLDAAAQRSRRVLPSGAGAPSNPAQPAVADDDIAWIQPIADSMIEPVDPADQAVRRDSVRLAMIAALQRLPARQRACLLLRDVLAMSAIETAETLGTSVAAVKSMLQRARARMTTEDGPGQSGPPADEGQRRWLLEQYLTAFEKADPLMLERVLLTDARLELPPAGGWFAGKQACMIVLREAVGQPGDWRMLAGSFNGQPGVAAYLRDASGRYDPFGIAVLDLTGDGIWRITAFGEPGLVSRFGFPAGLD